jgi:hypothetical protein
VMHDASKLSRAERIVSSLAEVSLDGLRQWFGESLA